MWRFEMVGVGKTIISVINYGGGVTAIGTTSNGRGGRLWHMGGEGL